MSLQNKISRIKCAIEPVSSVYAFVDEELRLLGEKHGPAVAGLARTILDWLTPEGGTPLSLPETDLQQKLGRAPEYSPANYRQALAGLARAGLIGHTDEGQLQISSNYLAQELNQLFLGQRTLRREMAALVRDKCQRKDLLSEKELNNVLPLADVLALTSQERAFVRRSQRAVKRRKRLRGGALLALILLLSTLVALIYRNYQEAEKARKVAVQASQEAKASEALATQRAIELGKQLDTVRSLNRELELARDKALASADEARQSAIEATAARGDAESLANRLAIANVDLTEQTERALLAEQQARDSAELARDKALEADTARQRAEALSLIIKSRNIALRVPQLPDEQVLAKAMLAYQAYEVNAKPGLGGDPDNGDIYKALYHALQSLRQQMGVEDTDQLKNVHKEYPMSIVAAGNGYYSAGADGVVMHWAFGGASTGRIKGIHPDVHNHLAISDDGRWLLICSRLPFVQLYDTSSGKLYQAPYPGNWGATDAIYEPESGKFLVAGYADSPLWFDPESRTLEPSGFQQPLKAIARYDGGYLGLTRDGQAVQDGQVQQDWPNILTAVAAAGTEGAGAQLALGDQYGDIYIEMDNADIPPVQIHQSAIEAMQYSPDGRYLASLSRDGKVSIIDIGRYLTERATYQPVLLDMKGLSASAIAFSKDSWELLLGSKGGDIVRFYLGSEIYAQKLCRLLEERGGGALDWAGPWEEYFQESGTPPSCK